MSQLSCGRCLQRHPTKIKKTARPLATGEKTAISFRKYQACGWYPALCIVCSGIGWNRILARGWKSPQQQQATFVLTLLAYCPLLWKIWQVQHGWIVGIVGMGLIERQGPLHLDLWIALHFIMTASGNLTFQIWIPIVLACHSVEYRKSCFFSVCHGSVCAKMSSLFEHNGSTFS